MFMVDFVRIVVKKKTMPQCDWYTFVSSRAETGTEYRLAACAFAADIEIFAGDRPRDNLYIDISCLFGFEYEQKQNDK